VRIESAVRSISWIPSEAIPGVMRLPFDIGPMHYDDPPGEQLTDIPALVRSGAVRFVNELRAWIDVEGGRIVAHGHSGRGWMGRTKLGFGSKKLLYPTIGMHDLRPQPEVGAQSVRFVQTTGGRAAVPLPRKLNRPPFVQIVPPVVWTTLALTLAADGSATHEVVGASPFPRHWIYDESGRLVQKVATTDFKTWSGDIFGEKTPWGREDSPAFVTEVESALERELSATIMRSGAKPKVRQVAGRLGRRPLPPARWGALGRCRRQGACRGRPGRDPRGAGPPGGRTPDRDPAGRDTVPGGRGERRTGFRRGPDGTCQRPSSGRNVNSLGATVHLRGPGVHTVAWPAVRSIRRKYLLCSAG